MEQKNGSLIKHHYIFCLFSFYPFKKKIVIVERHRTLTIFPYSSFFNLYKINFYFILIY